MEKTIMLGKWQAAGKKGRANMSWTDSMEEATGRHLQELSGAGEHRTVQPPLIHRAARSRS